MKEPKSKTESNPKPRLLASIDYVSPDNLRTTYLTNLFAAHTPEGSINVVGYVERKDFPKRAIITELPQSEGGGSTMEDEGDTGWIREIQTSFLISVSAAEGLIEVLQEALENLEAREVRIKKLNDEGGKNE